MTIALFSGQGSQYPGMGKDIIESEPELGAVYDIGSEILGRDLRAISFDSSAEELAATVNAQPAVLTASIVCLLAAHRKGFRYQAVAGHSLGEYAALYAAGILTLEDVFRVIKARCEAMDQAAREHKGTMAAVMKVEPAQVDEVCRKSKHYAAAVNFNSPQQTVIAGTPEGIAEVSEVFKEMKAKVVPLKVAGAFHSKLMKSAEDRFREAVKNINFRQPAAGIKFYSNVTGKEFTDYSHFPSLMSKHITSPVLFTSELDAISKDGFDTFVEFGPGKTLTGLVKRALKNVTAYNIENAETLAGASF
ncbi:MAG TPA: malonyl CoA-ACP transacylase [Ruminococcus sp.]|nr:malonyl CoA-ACP transacylase [Ruminococcus sp.]